MKSIENMVTTINGNSKVKAADFPSMPGSANIGQPGKTSAEQMKKLAETDFVAQAMKKKRGK